MDRRLTEAVAAAIDLSRGFEDTDAHAGQLGNLLRAARYRRAAEEAAGVRDAAQQLGRLSDRIDRSQSTNGRLAAGLNDLLGAAPRAVTGETT